MKSTLVLSDVGDETWGAVLEDDQVCELHVENRRRPGVAGNLYKGRVNRVLPGMQSAFIDIGLERAAFLHVSDLPVAWSRAQLLGSAPGEEDEEGAAGLENLLEAAEEPHSPGAEQGEGLAASGESCKLDSPRAVLPPIQDILREGQELLVQVAKEPIAAKGARVTAQVGLPGRALVYLPYLSRTMVSRRIEEPGERERLLGIVGRWRDAGGGWIVRTAAEGLSESELETDAEGLRALWSSLEAKERRAGAPVLLYSELGLAQRLLRDVLSGPSISVVVSSERLLGLARDFMASRNVRGPVPIRLAESGAKLFDDLGIHKEIERSLRSRIWLKGGGTIVVNPTEALVSIDVNTGKYVGFEDLEATALRTNLEAVREIVRLLRLRDLGGIIVIDFIDMTEGSNRATLHEALAQELWKDRSRTKLLGMSELGLVQLTRKRTRRSLDRALLAPCPTCEGSGRVRSALTVYYAIQREAAGAAVLARGASPAVRLHPLMIEWLDAEGLRLGATGVEGGGSVPGPGFRLIADPSMKEDEYEIVW